MTGSQHRALLQAIHNLEQRITTLEGKTISVSDAMLDDTPQIQQAIDERERAARRNIFWP